MMNLPIVLACLVLAVFATPSKNGHCPDATECTSSETCCMVSSGGYGCCSFEGATCCSDHIHCCPSGYKCATDRCAPKDDNSTIATFIPAVKIGVSVKATSKP